MMPRLEATEHRVAIKSLRQISNFVTLLHIRQQANILTTNDTFLQLLMVNTYNIVNASATKNRNSIRTSNRPTTYCFVTLHSCNT